MSTASGVFIYRRENYQFQMERFIERADTNYNEKKNGKKGLLKSKKTRIETTRFVTLSNSHGGLKSKKTRIETVFFAV